MIPRRVASAAASVRDVAHVVKVTVKAFRGKTYKKTKRLFC